MKDPIILCRADTLSAAEAGYWKDLLYRVVKIGTELEVAPPKGIKRAEFEAAVRSDLAPSGNLNFLGQFGVLEVATEHCGIEIKIIGRQPHFANLHRQYGDIINRLAAREARPRPTCGLHFHLLAPGLAQPLPEIIAANLWNLTRRYAPELKFITSGGHCRDALCRRRNHNSHLEMVRHSPATMTMAQIQQELAASRTVPAHQNFLNLEHLDFTPTGQIMPFHLEFRFPDADMSAAGITAKTFLLLAMLLKSVDLSQYGLIHVGKINPWRRKISLLDMLSNNNGNLAASDTSTVTDAVLEELRHGAFELLDLLAPVFNRFNSPAALEVLQALAQTPVSLMRCAGYGWADIENALAQRAAANTAGLDKTDYRLMQRIELGEWANQPSAAAWQWYAARELYLTPQELERRLGNLNGLRGLRWDARQGTMVFTS